MPGELCVGRMRGCNDKKREKTFGQFTLLVQQTGIHYQNCPLSIQKMNICGQNAIGKLVYAIKNSTLLT